MKRPLRTAVGVAAVTALLGGIAVQSAGADGATDRWPTYGPTFVLNSAGGVTGTDGIRVTFGGSQLAVQRQELADRPGEVNNETYGPGRLPGSGNASSVFNQIALAVGDGIDGGTAFIAPSFVEAEYDFVKIQHADNVDVHPWTVASTADADQIVSTLTGVVDGRTYTVVVTITYAIPDDRMKIAYQVVIPDGNTKPVRLYHLIDTYLGGDDEGPGFFTDPVSCAGSGESGAIVGVDRADQGVVEAFQFISGVPWTGYMSASYSDIVFGTGYKTNTVLNNDSDGLPTEGPRFGPGFMNDLNNQIITDPSNDNGIGINWNFGAAAGTYDTVSKLIFTSDTVDPCTDPDAVSVTNPDPTEVPDPIIDAVAPDPIFDELKDPDPDSVPETTPATTPPSPVVVPAYTG